MGKLNIYLYKTPGVHENIAKGILMGVDEFLKSKTSLKLNYKSGKWSKIKKEKEHYINLFFTNNSLTQSNIKRENYVEGNLIFKLKDLNDFKGYNSKSLNVEYLRVLRGKVAGYNELARLLNLECCTREHCAFNFEKKDLDNMAFLLHLNKEFPICRKHKNWKFY